MGKINDRVGSNLRNIRLARGLTAEELSSLLIEKYGIDMSSYALLRYERGHARLTVEDKIILSHALDCNAYALEDGADPDGPVVPEGREVKKLGAEEHQILHRIATSWPGDRRALILAIGCYAALPEAYALNAMLALGAEVTRALADGAISPNALPAGLPYLEQHLGTMAARVNKEAAHD